MSAHILVVDDHPINLKLVCDLLRWEGFEVTPAKDALSALAAIAAKRPNLILLDLQMPGIDGYELARRLKKGAATRSIPIVALTAFAMKGDSEKAREAGCDVYLTKPVDTRTLGPTLHDLLTSKQPET